MIDTQLSPSTFIDADSGQDSLQQYVHALLNRQHSLDLLETIEQQISQVWATIHRLLEGAGTAMGATQAVRVARAAQAVQAKNAYRLLEKRREETIAALHQSERRSNAALQAILAATAKRASKNARGIRPSSRTGSSSRTACRTQVKNTHLERN
jgi:hypothetical protein